MDYFVDVSSGGGLTSTSTLEGREAPEDDGGPYLSPTKLGDKDRELECVLEDSNFSRGPERNEEFSFNPSNIVGGSRSDFGTWVLRDSLVAKVFRRIAEFCRSKCNCCGCKNQEDKQGNRPMPHPPTGIYSDIVETGKENELIGLSSDSSLSINSCGNQARGGSLGTIPAITDTSC